MKGKNEKVLTDLEKKFKLKVKEQSPSEALDKMLPFKEQQLREQDDKLREIKAQKEQMWERFNYEEWVYNY